LLGLFNTWLMVAPDAAVAPVIPPVMVPIVQLKVLGVVAVNAMFGLNALHTEYAAGLVTAGFGSTVTMMVKPGPTHPPAVEVGVTIYDTVPDALELGLVSVWLIVEPDPALAPVIPPVTPDTIHE
jgi:hypothetical protein